MRSSKIEIWCDILLVQSRFYFDNQDLILYEG